MVPLRCSFFRITPAHPRDCMSTFFWSASLLRCNNSHMSERYVLPYVFVNLRIGRVDQDLYERVLVSLVYDDAMPESGNDHTVVSFNFPVGPPVVSSDLQIFNGKHRACCRLAFVCERVGIVC